MPQMDQAIDMPVTFQEVSRYNGIGNRYYIILIWWRHGSKFLSQIITFCIDGGRVFSVLMTQRELESSFLIPKQLDSQIKPNKVNRHLLEYLLVKTFCNHQ